MKCFKCPKDFDNLDTFFSHIQNTHRVKGTARCICTLCFKLFGDFSVYKRHVGTCSKKGMFTNEDLYNNLIGCEFNEELDQFVDSLKESALHLTLNLCAKPNFPRNAVFDIIREFTLFIKKITDGLKTVIMPKVEETRQLLQNLISSIESSFDRMNSEYNLNDLLSKMNLTKPLIKIDVELNKRIDTDECADESAEEGADRSDDEIDNEIDVEVANVIEKPKCTLVIMPIAHQIKQFFELPNVFAKIQSHTAAIEAETTLNHFIKGSVWQSKITNYGDGEIVIPYNFYVDGVQINNQLGPHTELGLENFNYLSFPTIPSEYQSRLNNIMVASLYQEKTIKTNGTKAVYGHIINELTALAHDGIVLHINNQPIKIFFVLGIFEGDNKECNRSLDFPGSHTAIHCCRFCRMDKDTMILATEEITEFLRTTDNYFEDVETNNMTQTGVNAWSVFNTVPYFHVVNGTANDLTHDLLEGVLPYCHSAALKRLIFNENNFTVDELNKRIKGFNYGPDNCGNIPPPISEKNLKKRKKKKVKMNAAEMFNYSQNVTFLIGDLIPELGEDGEVVPEWEFVKNIVKLFDLCFLPWYEPGELVNLSSAVKLVLEQYQTLCEHLKPVFHYLTHLQTNTKKYGPQRYVQTIRKEGKHKEMKRYTNNTNNRMNISLSIAKKIQNKNALRIYATEGLEDILTTTKLSKDCIKNKVYLIRGRSLLMSYIVEIYDADVTKVINILKVTHSFSG